MAPGTKRRRGDRQDSYDNYDRPPRQSPYRPEEARLAQRGRGPPQHGFQGPPHYENAYPGRGGRGSRRGARGGSFPGPQQQPNGPHASSRRPLSSRLSTDTGHDRHAEPEAQPAPESTPAADGPSDTATTSQPPPQAAVAPTPQPIPRPQITVEDLKEPPPPNKSPGPYPYDVLTEDRVESWQDSGRAEIIALAVEALQSEDISDAEGILQELVRAGLDAKLGALDAGSAVEEIISSIPEEVHDDAANMFLDTVSVMINDDDDEILLQRTRAILFSSNVSPDLMRNQLDDTVLRRLGLLSSISFKASIRKVTHFLYKQSNYNLIREETEGFSKLVTTVFTEAVSQKPTAKVAEDTFENIKALIGTFDLDAGRVLDITMDVFANLLVKHYRFFVRLLRQSSWWPEDGKFKGLETHGQGFGSLPPWAQPGYPEHLTSAEDEARIKILKQERDEIFWDRARAVGIEAFFQLGSSRVVNDEELERALQLAAEDDDSDRGEETRRWISETKTLPPPGSPEAAQLLGFKLKFYASRYRDANDTLPINLIYLSALLIKIGFISLRDLYQHLWPFDESMEEVKDKRMKERAEREQAKRPGGGALNALARAGALVDDTLPAPAVSRLRDQPSTRAATPSKTEESNAAKPDEDPKEQLPEPKDQKVELLKCLLCIGALPEALYMLGRFPWLIDGYPELVDLIHRILHVSLANVYDPVSPLRDRSGLIHAVNRPSSDQVGVQKGDIRLQAQGAPKVLKWAQPDKKDVAGTDYEFYWADWTDNVPVCQSVDDVFTLCSTFLNLSGVKIGQDPALMMKLARIGKSSLTDDHSESNRTRWLDLCKQLLIPALSLTGCNPGVVNEMYDLLKFFDTPTRYQVYNEWFGGATARLPDIASAFEQAKAETRDTMKRMSKTNMKPMARQLAKVACASPGVVFQAVFKQIESYSNLIDVVVECGRYFTYMSYDILTWTLLTALGRAGRDRVSQTTGTTLSLWLLSLSQFTGKVFRRYSMMNSLPILQYVLEQLRHDNFVDLQLLRDLCQTMGGIAPDTDFTESQVLAMAGGEILQAQTLKQVLDKRHESKQAGKRLTRTLMDHNLAAPLLVSIAQQRQKCIFGSGQNQLKVVSENFDGVQISLQQFLDLLRHNLSIKDFNKIMPDVASLIKDYGVEPSVAFMIQRKSIAKAIAEYDAAHPPAPKRASSSGNATMTRPSDLTSNNGQKGIEDEVMTEAVLAEDVITKADDAANSKSLSAAVDGDVDDSKQLWHPVLQELMDKLKEALPEEIVATMSMPFFVSFWLLSITDIAMHTASYNEEIDRQKARIIEIEKDRTDPSAVGAKRRDADKRHVRDFLANLNTEMKTLVLQNKRFRTRICKEKEHWFNGFVGKSMVLVNALLQECFVPRMLMSPLDSYFCWRMLNMMHSDGAPSFRTMHLIDNLLAQNRLSTIMFQCTGREAENFGRFLYELVKELNTWHNAKKVYERKAYGPKQDLPGFAQKMTTEGKIETLLPYESFRQLLYKWHTNIYKATKSCIDSGEYMHMKNAIVVLKGLGKEYPKINWVGKGLCDSLKPYLAAPKDGGTESREDVRVLSNSLMGLLKSNEKAWMLPQVFRSGTSDDASKKKAMPSRTTSQVPTSPRPSSSAARNGVNGDVQTPISRPETPQNANSNTIVQNGNIAVEDSDRLPQNSGHSTSNTAPTDAIVLTSDAEPVTQAAGLDDRSRSNETAQAIRAKLDRQRSQATDPAQQTPGSTSQQPATPSDGTLEPRAIADSRRPAPTASSAQSPPHGPSRPDTGRTPHGSARAEGRHDQQSLRDHHGGRNTPHSDRHSMPNERGARANGVPLSVMSKYDAAADYREAHMDSRRTTGREIVTGRPDLMDRRARPEDGMSRPSSTRPLVESSNDRATTTSGPNVDPARAAMIAGRDQQSFPQGSKSDEYRGTPGDRRNRPHSPARGPHDSNRLTSRMDDRQTAQSHPSHDGRNMRDLPPHDHAMDHAPNGPRGSGRQPLPVDPHAHPSDPMRPPPARPEREARTSRFQDTSRPQRGHQDESYGRLTSDNTYPSSPAQSPPVSRNGPDVNGVPLQPQYGHRPAQNSQFAQSSAVPPQDRGHLHRQVSSSQALSGPPTPGGERPPSAAEESTGIHPSRLAQIGQVPPALRPTPLQTQPQIISSPSSSQPPAGPRSATVRGGDAPLNSPSGPRGGAPSGPSSRRDSGQVDRRFSAMQDTIAGKQPIVPGRNAPPSGPGAQPSPGDQGISIRGGASGPSPVQTQSSAQQLPQNQTRAQQMQPQQQQMPPQRDDLFANRRAPPQNPQSSMPQAHTPQNGRDTPTSDHRDRADRESRDGHRDRDRDHRSGRDSGRASRRASREREHGRDRERERDRDGRSDRRTAERQLREEPQGQGQSQDQGRTLRGEALPGDRERDDRRGHRDREPRPPPRDIGRGRDTGRDGRMDERVMNGGSGRKRESDGDRGDGRQGVEQGGSIKRRRGGGR